MRVIDDMNVGWRILLWPEVALHPDYPFKDELPYNFRQEDDKYSRCFCYNHRVHIFTKDETNVSVSAHSAGAYTATLLAMVNVVEGGGRCTPHSH
jgi:hypothetical protein